MSKIDDCPAELAEAIREFWPTEEWDNAAAVAEIESGWSPFAENDTRRDGFPCGAQLNVQKGVRVTAEWSTVLAALRSPRAQKGIRVTAEWSIGWFQINACNLPSHWMPAHLFNTRHNVGTAHDMWDRSGWAPWFFTANQLGLL